MAWQYTSSTYMTVFDVEGEINKIGLNNDGCFIWGLLLRMRVTKNRDFKKSKDGLFARKYNKTV